jgi:hypothetical protein
LLKKREGSRLGVQVTLRMSLGELLPGRRETGILLHLPVETHRSSNSP